MTSVSSLLCRFGLHRPEYVISMDTGIELTAVAYWHRACKRSHCRKHLNMKLTNIVIRDVNFDRIT